MPAITSGKVLVTGANGYIAVWVVKSFLDRGFSVRGTVRSESKAAYLREYFKSFGDKLEIVIVEDIAKDGAFDAAVQGIDAIAHTASPFHMKAEDPEDLFRPALQGTLSVLKSAQRHGPTVKRIVVLSSCAAIHNTTVGPVLNESIFNEEDIEECKVKGKGAQQAAKYRASKVLAENAAWKLWQDNKATLPWDLTVLNPPWVFGPNIHEVSKPENLGESMANWFTNVVKEQNEDVLLNFGGAWIDVRDIAMAHVVAVTTPAAGGERFIISAGEFKYQDFVIQAHKWSDKIPAGVLSYDPTKAVHERRFDNAKGLRVLGMKYHNIEETTKDSLEDFKARGWL